MIESAVQSSEFAQAMSDMAADAIANGKGLAATEVELPEAVIAALDASNEYFKDKVPFIRGHMSAMYETLPFMPLKFYPFRGYTAAMASEQEVFCDRFMATGITRSRESITRISQVATV